jgi:hypothetical protein
VQAAALACGRSRQVSPTTWSRIDDPSAFRAAFTGSWVLCSEAGLTGHPHAAMEVQADGKFTLLGWNVEGTNWERLPGAENQGQILDKDPVSGRINVVYGGGTTGIVAIWWQGPRSLRLEEAGVTSWDYVAAEDLQPVPAILP